MAIRDSDRANFNTLKKAWEANRILLAESRDVVTGEYRTLLCAFNKDGGDILPVPIAVMVWDNPYELFMDPTAETLPAALDESRLITALKAAQAELHKIANLDPPLVSDDVIEQLDGTLALVERSGETSQ